ncbi:MAG: PD40 domain-containing protein [Kordiimonadaceae bacterium]|nr:PD40 domain-containing protein [Kordiimonadaceae bacterium]MBO6568508.1 PD40 domain-containing protein [Kordiimonadaceae bacterium]MBO6963763.1 PD40 domain-containing protein [Kordiimonadaceae bacterium]
MKIRNWAAVAALMSSVSLSASVAAAESDWFRQAAISPDGETIAFSYLGNIFTVPARGGSATPLTTHAAWEGHPVWSKDGSMIAFASDRYGNKDIFVMPATGGKTTRLTFHQSDDVPTDFHPDGSHILFSSVRQDSAASTIGFTRAGELYSVRTNGGTPEMVLTTPASEARYNEDATQIIYRSETGYEDEFRKHDKSPFSRDVWVVDLASGAHTNLTNTPGGDHSPVFGDRAGRSFFVSDRSGIFNVYRQRGDDVEALTNFTDHPVRSLSRAEDGTLAFTNHGELYTLKSGRLRKLAVTPAVSVPEGETIMLDVASRADEFALSPDGKEIAFVAHGNVFVTSVDYATTRQVTDTAEEEADVAFSPDGKTLYYSAERDNKWSLFEVSKSEDGEPYFYAATSLNEQRIDLPVEHAYQPTPSPDGKKLAFMGNTRTLMVLERESGALHEVTTPVETFSTAARGTTFAWSPDSQNLVYDMASNGRLFFSNIAIRPFDASAPARDISLSGYTDTAPAWHPSGDAITWFSARYGRRDHGSHGTEFDVMAGFLTDDAWAKFLRSKEDIELAEKNEKDAKKDEKEEESDENAAKEEEVAPTPITWERLDKRQQRLTIHSSDLSNAVLSKDMDKLFYVSSFEGGFDLWVQDFKEDETKKLTPLGNRVAGIELSKDGKTLVALADGRLKTISVADGKSKSVQVRARMALDAAAERQYLFDHAWKQADDWFYKGDDKHGRNWDAIYTAYKPKVASIAHNRDMAELLSEVLGELNASHTGARYRANGGTANGRDRTASLGAIYDMTSTGSGLTIDHLYPEGPLARADGDVAVGDRITAINGTAIDAGTNYFDLMNNQAGARVRVTLNRADGGEAYSVVVKPASAGDENGWAYERWIEGRQADVERLSNGRLGYVHLPFMADSVYRRTYRDVFGKYFAADGLVVDSRWNRGGDLMEDLIRLLTSGDFEYTRNAPYGIPAQGEPLTRWTKPTIVLMNEANYSDGHCFPTAYKNVNGGLLVGTAVTGTCTYVWWERAITGDIIFGVPSLGIFDPEGDWLELKDTQPDIEVYNSPEDRAAGRDTQLETAVNALIQSLYNE